jgi:hypothetical protein
MRPRRRRPVVQEDKRDVEVVQVVILVKVEVNTVVDLINVNVEKLKLLTPIKNLSCSLFCDTADEVVLIANTNSQSTSNRIFYQDKLYRDGV